MGFLEGGGDINNAAIAAFVIVTCRPTVLIVTVKCAHKFSIINHSCYRYYDDTYITFVILMPMTVCCRLYPSLALSNRYTVLGFIYIFTVFYNIALHMLREK